MREGVVGGEITIHKPSVADGGEKVVAAQPLNPRFERLFKKMDNVTVIQYIQRLGMARSSLLLSLSEEIFAEASRRFLALSVKYVPGGRNCWVDTQSRF